MRSINRSIVGICVLALAGCGDSQRDDGADIGQVTLTIAQAPSDVRCLVVTVASNSRTERSEIEVISDQSVTASLTGLPVGNVSLGALAYVEACSAVTSSSVPTWISDPATRPLTLVSGTPFDWNLVLRPNGVLNATVDWVGDDANMPSGVAKSVSLGLHHSCVLLGSGFTQCWGDNGYGQLGNTVNQKSSVPVTVSGISSAVTLAAGSTHTCAVLGSGSVRCWGNNALGQLGNGETGTGDDVPVPVSGISNAVAVAAGSSHSCAVLSSGSVQCWGYAYYGQLGNGIEANDSPVPVTVAGVTSAIAVAAGFGHSCAMLSSGSVQCWGDNSSGELGNGDYTESSVPVTVSGVTSAFAMAAGGYHSCAVLTSGSVQCWGANLNGQLGDGSTGVGRSLPVNVPSVTNAIALAAGGYHSCAVLSSGSVQCWGRNDFGQLGNGATTDSSMPVTVSGISNAVAVAAGDAHTCAVLSSGSVQCWGDNYFFGQLGDGTSMSSSVPVTVQGY